MFFQQIHQLKAWSLLSILFNISTSKALSILKSTKSCNSIFFKIQLSQISTFIPILMLKTHTAENLMQSLTRRYSKIQAILVWWLLISFAVNNLNLPKFATEASLTFWASSVASMLQYSSLSYLSFRYIQDITTMPQSCVKSAEHHLFQKI